MEGLITQGPKGTTPLYLYMDMKEIFTEKLISYLMPLIHEGFYSIYEDSFKEDEKKALIIFQDYLEKINKIDGDNLDREVVRILSYYKDFKLDDLYEAIMKIYQKLYNIDSDEDKVPFKDFIKECYSVISREFYTSAYLFDHERDNYERQRNFRQIKIIIREQLKTAILNCLPNRHMLNKFLEMHSKDKDIRSSQMPPTEGENNNLSKIINSILPQSHHPSKTTLAEPSKPGELLKQIMPQEDSNAAPAPAPASESGAGGQKGGATPMLNVKESPLTSDKSGDKSKEATPEASNFNIEDKIKDLIAKQTISNLGLTKTNYKSSSHHKAKEKSDDSDYEEKKREHSKKHSNKGESRKHGSKHSRHSGGRSNEKDLSNFLNKSKKNNNEISVVSVNEFDSKNNLNKFNIAEVFSNKKLLKNK